LYYLIQAVNTRLVHVILAIFQAVRTGLSCSWKQLFAVGSNTEFEVKYKSFENNHWAERLY